MLVELVSTGSELLLGEIVNANAQWLAQQLNNMGYSVVYQTTVGDNYERMEAVIRTAVSRADIIITTGGLGPTQGDITKEVAAKVMDTELIYHGEIEAMIKEWFEQRERKMQKGDVRQAMIPEGGIVLTNEAGTAPGVVLAKGGKTIVHLPGPPREMKWMFEKRLRPYLLETFGEQGSIYSRVLKIYDMGEGYLEAKIMDFIKNQGNPTVALLAKRGFMELRLTARGKNAEEVISLIRPVELALIQQLQGQLISFDEETMAEMLERLLSNKHYTIATAESCTGGMVGSELTDVPGSSAYYKGGVITYCDEMKHSMLKVSKRTLATKGAVSGETARQMAEGCRALFGTDLAISTTGIAGPGGAAPGKPIGLVYISIAGPQGVKTYKNIFTGNRSEVRVRTSKKALYYAVKYLREEIK